MRENNFFCTIPFEDLKINTYRICHMVEAFLQHKESNESTKFTFTYNLPIYKTTLPCDTQYDDVEVQGNELTRTTTNPIFYDQIF